MKILGLDLGCRRVGVAVSDPGGVVAHPLDQLEVTSRRAFLEAVARLVADQGVGRVVVGMPLLADGRRGQQARWTDQVVAALRQALPVPVTVWDERYSTHEADEAMREAGLKPHLRRARRDKVAATLMLQAYLDSGAPPAP